MRIVRLGSFTSVYIPLFVVLDFDGVGMDWKIGMTHFESEPRIGTVGPHVEKYKARSLQVD